MNPVESEGIQTSSMMRSVLERMCIFTTTHNVIEMLMTDKNATVIPVP